MPAEPCNIDHRLANGSKLDELEQRLERVRAAVREGYARRAAELEALLDDGEHEPLERDEVRRHAHRRRGVAQQAQRVARAAELEELCTRGSDGAIREACRAVIAMLRAPTAPEEAATSPPPAAAPRSEGLGWLVVAVDDEPATRRLLELTLVKLGGCRARLASTGTEVLAILAALDAPPDLVLLDAMLPDMDGLALLREVRARLGPTTPIAILSAATADELGWALPEDRRLRWLRKPFRPANLLAELRELTAGA